ncbi:MAG: LCP family protein [Solirubrobacterales bacterium]|nr:LCP family protein [Solirubrobacterales bacterium]
MPEDPDEPEYRVYSAKKKSRWHKGRDAGSANAPSDPPAAQASGSGSGSASGSDSGSGDADAGYQVYRSSPRGLRARLLGLTDSETGRRAQEAEREIASRREASRSKQREQDLGSVRRLSGSKAPLADRPEAPPAPAYERSGGPGLGRWGRGTWTWRRALKYLVCAVIGWVLLSAVLFFISAQTKAGNVPKSLKAALTGPSVPMIASAENVLVLGLDTRPKTGANSKEPGANHNESTSATDSIMLWHVGGGVSRRLSIPRDTLVNIPGEGKAKINAAWSKDPGLTVKVVESLTGVKINHVIVVDLGRFPKFIDDIGGVTVKTSKICSNISGGVKNGGSTLNLSAGSHHLSGAQALVLARTRENSCNPAYTDLQREAAQQQIMNGIKNQLFSVHAFFNLPWASWDAPGVIQTDMGGFSLLELFASAEIGGTSKPMLLSETAGNYGGADVLIPNQANINSQVHKLLHG